MTIEVVEAARTGGGAFATLGGGERTSPLFVLASRQASDIYSLAQEEAAIDAEDILTQAEEANALDPVG
jgi:hypothetical protein